MTVPKSGYNNEIPYTASFHPYLAPAVLNWVTAAAGHQPIPLDQPFRWLEIACGNAVTPVMLGACHPEGKFVAIDIEPRHVAYGRELARECRAPNVQIERMGVDDLLEPRLDWAPFDFVVCHGLISWVSPGVRETTFRAIDRWLRPGGTLFLSYNTEPGQAHSLAIRKVFASMTDPSLPAAERIAKGLDLLDELHEKGAASLAGERAKAAIARLKTSDRTYLVHEYLNEHWDSLWYADVAARLGEMGVNFAGSGTLNRNIPEFCMTKGQLEVLRRQPSPNPRQQMQDLLMDEQFRRDIWVRSPWVPPTRQTTKALQAIRVGLAAPSVEMATVAPVPVGKANFEQPYHKVMLERIEHQGLTVADTCVDVPDRAPPVCEKMVEMMVATGVIRPMVRPYVAVDRAVVADPATRWEMACLANAWVTDRNADDPGLRLIAAPVIGTAFNVGATDSIVLRAICEAGLEGAADAARAHLRSRSLHLVVQGKEIAAGPEEDAAIADTLGRFANGRLLQWWRLGILRPRTP